MGKSTLFLLQIVRNLRLISVIVPLEYRAELYSRLESKRKKRESREYVEQLKPPKQLKVNIKNFSSLTIKTVD